VFTPAHANAYRDASLVVRRATATLWTAFLPHRDVSTSFGISAAVHLVFLLGIGAALYEEGEDNADIPELSVQLVTREGPNDEEFSEASMPVPVPVPVEDVLDNPGTSEQTLDAPVLADHSPLLEHTPGVVEFDNPASVTESTPETGPVLTTIGESASEVALVAELAPDPAPMPAAEPMREPEQVMLTRNVKELAAKLLDTNTTATTLSWQQDGQQYSARVMRQPAADSTGLEQVIADIFTSKDGKRMKTRVSLKRLSFSHFTQLVNDWDPNIQLHEAPAWRRAAARLPAAAGCRRVPACSVPRDCQSSSRRTAASLR
jgi:hypothetical protein